MTKKTRKNKKKNYCNNNMSCIPSYIIGIVILIFAFLNERNISPNDVNTPNTSTRYGETLNLISRMSLYFMIFLISSVFITFYFAR